MDTCIFFWGNLDVGSMANSLCEIISDGKNEVFYYSASAWKNLIKSRLDRFLYRNHRESMWHID